MSGARYPLASLLALRERERDAAAQTLADAMGTLAHETEQVRLAAEAHARALRDLAAYQLHDGSKVGAAELASRALHRDRLRDLSHQCLQALEQVRGHERAAAADVERARDLLAAARAAHRAVELHHAEHVAAERAAAEAREEDALDEAAQGRAHLRAMR